MKLDEFKAMSETELKKQLDASRQELFNLRFRLATKQLVNHREIPRVKKKIARLETILREKELSEIEEKA